MMTPKEMETIKKQKQIFMINDDDDESTIQNKKKYMEFIQLLEEKGILAAKTMDDFEVLRVFENGRSEVFKAIEKNDENADLEKKPFKAIKKIEVFLKGTMSQMNEISYNFVLNHKNILKLEKVFFQQNDANGNDRFTCFLVMPFVENDFMSWLVKDQAGRGWKGHSGKTDFLFAFEILILNVLISNLIKKGLILKSKRNFEEVRDIFTQILEGLAFMHSKDYSHLDIKFDNILIDENNCVKIADLGLTKQTGKDISITVSNIGYTPGMKFFSIIIFFFIF